MNQDTVQTSHPGSHPRLLAMMLIAAAVLLSACGGISRTHGTFFSSTELSQLQVGQSTQQDVLRVLGSPLTTNSLEGLRWVYVGQVSEQRAFLEPEITRREVVIVAFDPQGRVSDLRQLDLSDGIPMEPVEGATPTSGRDLTLMQQIFGNIGRFSNEGGN